MGVDTDLKGVFMNFVKGGKPIAWLGEVVPAGGIFGVFDGKPLYTSGIVDGGSLSITVRLGGKWIETTTTHKGLIALVGQYRRSADRKGWGYKNPTLIEKSLARGDSGRRTTVPHSTGKVASLHGYTEVDRNFLPLNHRKLNSDGVSYSPYTC